MHVSEYVPIYVMGRDVSARTIDDYTWVANYFTRDTCLRFSDLTAASVNAYLVSLKDREWSPESIKSFRTKFLTLWRAAYADGYTDNRPDVDRIRKIRVAQPNPKGLNAEQARTLIEYCETHHRRRMRLISVPKGDYLAALFGFLWDTDMRLGDSLSMEFNWIQAGHVTWLQSKTKRWHRAKVSEKTLGLIDRIRSPERRLIWPRPSKSQTSLFRMIRRAFIDAGLEGSSKWIRRGAATDVYLSGGDPSRALGHVPGSRVAYRHYVSQEAQLEPVSPTEL